MISNSRRWFIGALIAALSGTVVAIATLQVKKTSPRAETTPKIVELKASSDLWNKDDNGLVTDASLIQVKPDRILATVGDTLYMLDSGQQVIWKWAVGKGENIVGQPFMDSTETVYGVAVDGISFALEGSSGKLKFRDQGTGSYSDFRPFRGDVYLVVSSMAGFRASGHDYHDYVTAYKGTQQLGKVDFPDGGELSVVGDKIFAITRKKGVVTVEKLDLPLP